MHPFLSIERWFKRFIRSTAFLWAVAAVWLLAGTPQLHAQITATISGTVTDSTGAVVPGATVVVTNEATNQPRRVISNKSGVFAVPDLNPSSYSIEVTAKGFSPKEVTGVEVHSGDSIKLQTFALAVGEISDQVTVTNDSGQIMETENGQRSETLTARDIQDLALTGRDTTELLKVLPGAVVVGNNGYNDLSTTTGNSAVANGISINGAPYKGGTAINMDGASILDIGDDFSALASINPDMTQEVQVLTSGFGADTAGGPNVINATSKSGTKNYHGTAWFVVRNDVLNANDWQDNHHTNAAGMSAPNPKGGAAYYYPGGDFGGPVPYTHKKAFFYGAFERLLQNQGNLNIARASIPSPEMLAGDFSTGPANNRVLCPGGFVNAANANVGYNGQAYNGGVWCQNITPDNGNTQYTILPDGSTVAPVGGAPVVTSYGSTTVTASNGGIIPAKYLDPNMIAYSKLWPAWGSPSVASTTAQIINNGGYNYVQTIVNHDNGWIAHGRVDYNFTENDHFYISYQQSYDGQLSGGCGEAFYSACSNNQIEFPGGGLQKQTYGKVLTGHYVHIFSPTLTNEALVSWVYGNIPITPGTNPSADYRSTLGASFGCIYCANPKYMPTFSSNGVQGGYPAIGTADDWEPNNYYIVKKSVATYADNLTKVWGIHTLQFGALSSNTDNYQGNQSTNLQGVLTIGGTPANNYNYFARAQGTAAGNCTGTVTPSCPYGAVAGQNYGSYNTTADFVTGTLTNYQESNASPLSDLAFQQIAIYAQDQIRATKKLSIQVGFRFEHVGGWYDRQGNGLAVFYPNRVLTDFYAGKYAPGYYWHAIDAGVPLSGHPNRFGFVSPRLGLSYDLFGNGKTLFRGGFGAYRYQESANTPQAALNTAQGVQNFNASNNVTNVNQSNSAFQASQLGQLAALVPQCQIQCKQNSQNGYDPSDYGVPLVYSWNFTIDQRLPWKMLLDVAYVGNHASRLSDNGQDGTATGNIANQNKVPLHGFGQLVNGTWQGNKDPFTQKVICNPENLNATCSSGSSDADFRPFGRGIGCTSAANTACTIYGSNAVNEFEHNNYQNYNALQVSLAKRAGPVSINANFTWSKSLGTVVNWDPFRVASNNTYTNLERPYVFNASYIYRVPNFFHGNRLIGGAVNGWQVSGISLWQDGSSTLPTINIQYDPQSVPAAGNQYSVTTSTLGVGASTFFGTNAGFVTARPQITCNPKAGLVSHQLYRPCFTAAAFGSSGGYGLPFVAGQAFLENDLSLTKTFKFHDHNSVRFTASAFNWLNHPLPAFGSGESTTEYYFYDYNTHAVKVNDTCPGNITINGNVISNPAPGSCNAGSPIVSSNVYGTANGKPADLFGTQHFKQGFVSGNSQRTMEFELKYNF